MSSLAHEVMSGERGLGTLSARWKAYTESTAELIESELKGELEALALYFEDRAAGIEKTYRDIGLEGEREARCLREVAQALKCRASGRPP